MISALTFTAADASTVAHIATTHVLGACDVRPTHDGMSAHLTAPDALDRLHVFADRIAKPVVFGGLRDSVAMVCVELASGVPVTFWTEVDR